MRCLLLSLLMAASCGSSPFAGGVPDAGALDGGSILDGGTTTDGGNAVDGGSVPDGGPAQDGGPALDGGAALDGGPPSWDPDAATENTSDFPLGVQAGDATNVAVILWTRYLGSSNLTLRVLEDTGNPGPQPLRFDVPAAVGPGGFTHVEIGGLLPGGRYRYAFVESGGTRSPVGRFRAAMAPGTSGVVRFGATSCTKQSVQPFDTLAQAAALNLDFFLNLGDTSYNDDAETQAEYRARWAENLSTAPYRELFASTAHYTTWDDHEVVDNWDPESVDPQRLATAREAFFETLAIRRLPPPNENRIWRRFRWGDAVEVFVLDCRGERKPSTRNTDAAQYISPEQLAWLQEGLRSSTAAFKVIANSVPIANFPTTFDILAVDRWEGYQVQRDAILDFITEGEIKGVVWLSGDFHLGAVARIEASGTRSSYYDILAGPGGNNGNLLTFMLTPPQFELATRTQNVVIFEADTTVVPPTLKFSFVDGAGDTFFEKTLTP